MRGREGLTGGSNPGLYLWGKQYHPDSVIYAGSTQKTGNYKWFLQVTILIFTGE